MSLKFQKNRLVSIAYAKIPIYYTRIFHPHNKYKELVLMDRLGDSYTACWRNSKTGRCGIEKIIKATERGFIFKDKEYRLKCKVL